MDKNKSENIPTFKLIIDPENQGFVNAVAVTDNPATESFYLAFSKDKEKVFFSANDAKQEIFGAAIVPDILIKRNANELVKEAHNVFFSADDIRLMSKEFFKQGFNSNLNLNHTDEVVKGYFFQSIIVGDEIGQGKVNGLDLPAGTWALGAYIEDKSVYEKIKQYGFSVEGLFTYMTYQQGFTKNEISDSNLLKVEIEKLTKNINRVTNQYLKKR